MKIRIDADIEQIVREYRGDPGHLERALGAYVLGQFYGWRVLRLIHGQDSLKRYAGILGVDWSRDVPERTGLSSRCRGIRIADKVGAYWRVVRGNAAAGQERRQFTDAGQPQRELAL